MCSTWLGGGRALRPLFLFLTFVFPLCLCFVSLWYLRSVEVRLGVVLRVTV